jgi:hypothetical protein
MFSWYFWCWDSTVSPKVRNGSIMKLSKNVVLN